MMPDLDHFNDHFIYVSIASAWLNTLKCIQPSTEALVIGETGNQINTNQIKFWFLVRGENRSSRGKTSRLFLLPLLSLAIQLRLWRYSRFQGSSQASPSVQIPSSLRWLEQQHSMLSCTFYTSHSKHCTEETVGLGSFSPILKKGFDLVYHRILLDKIKLLEVHPCLLRWIASFLEGRSQVVIFLTTLQVKRGHSPGNAFRPAAICGYGQ